MHPYIVGERGRELFVPETAGVIVPNHVLTSPIRVGGGRSTQITVSLGEVHVGGRLSATEGDAVARDLAERVTREVVRKLRVAQAVG
ncbi:hypothetical protein [Stomatohabitans albus]|uniref:hypothetical protein n=1 Tax=Stomatohabitans albus TaxID=3110766 RepID=UPI00300CF785